MIGEILSGINILEKLSKFTSWVRGRKSIPADTIVTRFVRLFESHGVHRNQIPRFFGHGLTLKDVQDDDSLLAKLEEPLLDAACNMFSIRREWLDGADTQIHPCHDFYKYPEKFLAFLLELKNENFDAHIEGVLIAPEELGNSDALMILQETIGHVGEKPIFRYHICHNWRFSYWKARAYLAACVAIAWKERVFIHGVHLPKIEIVKLSEGETLLGWQGEGIWKFGSVTWHPEDMALLPKAFLEGIDPEEDKFGIKSALKLWLDLEKKGLMDIGQSSVICETPRLAFQQELKRY